MVFESCALWRILAPGGIDIYRSGHSGFVSLQVESAHVLVMVVQVNAIPGQAAPHVSGHVQGGTVLARLNGRHCHDYRFIAS